MLKRITLILGLLLTPVAALAQSSVLPYYYNSGGVKTPVGSSNPLPVSASVSASISGFPTVQTTGTPISVTTGGVTGTLPAGAVVVASNVGTTNAAYCKLGASATTSDQYIAPSGGWFAFTVGANTQLTCITSTSTTTVNMVGGSGLPTGTGGGSGGGGGGGAITAASGSYASGALSSGSVATGAYASGSIGSGAVASGAIASGAFASGSVGSGAYASGSIASGALASGSIASGAMVDLLTMRGTVAGGTVAANSLLTGGQYNSTPITVTNTQQAALQLDANGYLKVNTAAGAAAGGTSSNFGSAFPTPGTAIGMSDGTNMVAMRSTAYGTTPTGLNAMAVNAFVTNSNANGRAVVANSSPVVPVAAASTVGNIAANNTTAVVVKASAGTLFGVQLGGIGSAPAYLKIYNATSATCGSGTPVKRLIIPAASTAANGAGSNIPFGAGLAFSTGITYCITTGIGDADTTAPAANTFLVNVDYE